jgi:hypothetical protein
LDSQAVRDHDGDSGHRSPYYCDREWNRFMDSSR